MDIGVIDAVVVAVVTVLATGYAYFRSTAVKVWEQNSKAYQARVEVLEQQNRELSTQLDWLKQRIQELEARPDYTEVAALIGRSEHNIITAVEAMRQEAIRNA